MKEEKSIIKCSGMKKIELYYSDIKCGLVKLIAHDFMLSILFESIDIEIVKNELQKQLDKYLTFETTINDACFNLEDNSISGNVCFLNEENEQSEVYFIVKPTGVLSNDFE